MGCNDTLCHHAHERSPDPPWQFLPRSLDSLLGNQDKQYPYEGSPPSQAPQWSRRCKALTIPHDQSETGRWLGNGLAPNPGPLLASGLISDIRNDRDPLASNFVWAGHETTWWAWRPWQIQVDHVGPNRLQSADVGTQCTSRDHGSASRFGVRVDCATF